MLQKIKRIFDWDFNSSTFPFYRQLDKMDCGPVCLKMIAKYYGRSFDLSDIKSNSHIDKSGVSFFGISEAANQIGIESLTVKIELDDLIDEVSLPCIIHWNNNHFVVVYKIKSNRYYIADPAYGLINYTQEEFIKGWYNSDSEKNGYVLLLETTKDFYKTEDDINEETEIGFLFNYFKPYKKLIFQLIVGFIISSFLLLLLPFLTQGIVDYGIGHQNIKFIYLILFAQLFFFISNNIVNSLRGWILLHITSRINIKMLSDFLEKLLKLPIAFFDTIQTGDLIQRINDHQRIEEFLSTNSLNSLFGLLNIILFGSVLAYFNIDIFLVFLFGTLLYFLWSFYFLKKRAKIDYMEFKQNSKNQTTLLQLIRSIQEIKLNNSQRRRKSEWKNHQIKLFDISLKGLKIFQKQIQGGQVINEFKNILIIFLSAKSVVDGQITLGTMLAIQYIVGQLNIPINNIVTFLVKWQDASLSIKRLSEIHLLESETSKNLSNSKIFSIPDSSDIILNNVSFRYGGSKSKLAIDDVNITIPFGKVTAIVGTSGSGKTTLLKILLKFYSPSKGTISIGSTNISSIDTSYWRTNCGVVMQDGYIFDDTIERNITESRSNEPIDINKLQEATRLCRLEKLINELPSSYQTTVGSNGNFLSGGEKQRLLIARAVYKEPRYLFFDEATSSLDSENEKVIMNNLIEFYKNRTTVIIAHRLSTVKSADQILVMDNGKIIESGNHKSLLNLKGKYYQLVKNQL